MYQTERREALRQLISRQGFASIRELADQFDVSEITIRRDLKVLKQKGHIEKVVGGGQAISSTSEMSFTNKRSLQQREKQAIAKHALSLIEPGLTIGISAGTTTWTFAQYLKPMWNDLSFVTNSTNVALELKANGWSDIYLTGGHFRTPSDALVGPLAEEIAKKLYTDILFLGIHGIDLSHGVTSPNVLEASINRVMLERAGKVVLLFDHTKWDARGIASLADLSEIDVIVTNGSMQTPEIEKLRSLGIEVMVSPLS